MNKKRYLLKGLLIGLIVGLLFLLWGTLTSPSCANYPQSWFCKNIFTKLFTDSYLIFVTFQKASPAMMILVVLGFFGITGTIAGGRYGLIKKAFQTSRARKNL